MYSIVQTSALTLSEKGIHWSHIIYLTYILKRLSGHCVENRFQRGYNQGGREWKLNPGSNSGSGDKLSNSSSISNIELTYFAGVLDVKGERKKKVKDKSQRSVPDTW